MTVSASEPLPTESAEVPAAGEKLCPTCGTRYPNDYAVCPRDATPLARQGGTGDPLIGQVLGDTYEITRCLGEGGMGKVYEARHVRLGRRFAVKMLHQHFLADAESVARFRREATAAAAVTSPYVAQVVDVHATRDGRPFIVSELLVGEELADVLRRDGAMEIGKAAGIARQIARGLAAAHAASVVHRDLKPENVMLVRAADGSTVAKVVDFGIAKSLTEGNGSLTRTGVILGTPAYMAPEQARASANLDHRVDIYSLGAVIYRMVTGKPAFTGDDPSTTLSSVLYDEPARPKTLRSEVPEAFELVVQKAMAKNPDGRFASMLELDAALAPFDTEHVAGAAADPQAELPRADATGGHADVGRAATVALSGTIQSLAATYSEGARAKNARPRAVVFGVASVLWIALTVFATVVGMMHALAHRSLAPIEAAFGGSMAGVLAMPVVILFVRDVMRGAWRNTAGMLVRAEALSQVLAASFAAYAVVSIGWRIFDGVVAHGPSAGWGEAAAAIAALATLGGMGWFHLRRIRRA